MVYSILFVFIFQHIVYSKRIFRLKKPGRSVYLGKSARGHLAFRPFYKSDIFEDRSSEYYGYVNVKINGYYPKVWTTTYNQKYLVYHTNNDDYRQQFRAIHLKKDMVAIKSRWNHKCLDYTVSTIKLRRCNRIYKNQRFLITDTRGSWYGSSIYNPYYSDYGWGRCFNCLPGGFGSNDQGFAAAIASQSILGLLNSPFNFPYF